MDPPADAEGYLLSRASPLKNNAECFRYSTHGRFAIFPPRKTLVCATRIHWVAPTLADARWAYIRLTPAIGPRVQAT
jgi:hypothetical protein